MAHIQMNVSARASINIFENNTKYIEVKEDDTYVYIRPTVKKDYTKDNFYMLSRKQANCTTFGLNTEKMEPKKYYIFELFGNEGWYRLVEVSYSDIDQNSNYASTKTDNTYEANNKPYNSYIIEMNTYTRINYIDSKVKSFKIKNDNGVFMFKPSKEEINNKNGRILSKKQFTAVSNCLKSDTFYEVSKVRGGWLMCKETNDNKGKNTIHVMAA